MLLSDVSDAHKYLVCHSFPCFRPNSLVLLYYGRPPLAHCFGAKKFDSYLLLFFLPPYFVLSVIFHPRRIIDCSRGENYFHRSHGLDPEYHTRRCGGGHRHPPAALGQAAEKPASGPANASYHRESSPGTYWVAGLVICVFCCWLLSKSLRTAVLTGALLKTDAQA